MVETINRTRVDRYTAAILHHRWLVVASTTLLMLAMMSGMLLIGVTNDYRSLFREDNPQLAALDALENTYSVSNTALIAVSPREGSVFTRETLHAIEELTEAAWQTPYSTRVDSLTNYNHSEALGDDLIVEPLVDDAQSLSDADLVRIEDTALNTMDTAGRLVSRDGRVGGLAINFTLPEQPDADVSRFTDYLDMWIELLKGRSPHDMWIERQQRRAPRDAAVIELTDYLETLLDEARTRHPDIAYYLTGDVVMNRAFADATKGDMENLTPIVFCIIVAAAIVFLRSILAAAAVVVTLMFTVNTTMGFAGWVGTMFTPVNSGVPIIVMTVAVAHSIHIVTSLLSGMHNGLSRNESIVESLRINAYPVFLTSATTAIAFLSLNASDSPPFHVLGNLVAFGVVCAFVYAMTLLPAMLSILPLRTRAVHAEQPGFFDRFGMFVVERRAVLLWCTALVAMAMITGIPRIEMTDNWTQYFDDRYTFRQDTDFVIERLTGVETLEYSLKAGREGGITDPKYLRAVDAFAEWFREQPESTHVQAFPDIMKRLNKNMHGDDPGFYKLPDDADLAAQYLLVYELSLPFGSDLNNRIDIAKSATRMSVVLRSLSSRQQRELDARAQDWFRANASDLATEASGVSIVFAHLSQRNIESMMQGTMIAMALISFILIWVLKSLRLGLTSLVPNFIPAAMSFGLWGYVVGHVGLAGSVMTAIAFGIIVDDTIHFMSKYLKARRNGLQAPDAVRFAFRTVGQALWTTTVILSLGFLVFAASGFEISWTLGIMVTTTISFALIADFLLLPPLLMTIDKGENP